MPSVHKHFAARLRQLREAQGLSVEEAAHYAKVDRTYLYALERADGWPSAEKQETLASIYHVDVADLWVFPELDRRHKLRELVRLTPSARLGALIAAAEQILGKPLEEMTSPPDPEAAMAPRRRAR